MINTTIKSLQQVNVLFFLVILCFMGKKIKTQDLLCLGKDFLFSVIVNQGNNQ
jgi:hypothetical protein